MVYLLRERSVEGCISSTLFLAARKSTQAQGPGTELRHWPVGIKVRIKLRLRSPKSGDDELVSVH